MQFSEVQDFIAQAQQEFFGLAPDALAAVRYTLNVEKNAMIGLTVLERTGAAAQLPETTTQQNGHSRQAVLIPNVLLEGREHMGLDWGPEIEEALAKDVEGSAEGANVERKPATAVSLQRKCE